MEGEIKMPTKTLEREETLPANNLRSLSQKSLIEMVENYEKLGLIVNNQLSIAMLSWDKYEGLVDLLQNQQEEISKLQSVIEDFQLVAEYGEDVLKAEKGQSESFVVDSAEELFKIID